VLSNHEKQGETMLDSFQPKLVSCNPLFHMLILNDIEHSFDITVLSLPYTATFFVNKLTEPRKIVTKYQDNANDFG